jgi:peptidoglycan/xylan/chitin deacetylase (PgdA/CDA1 family)
MGNPLTGPGLRRAIKYGLAAASSPLPAMQTSAPTLGATLLIYHRIGDGTPDELDLAAAAFDAQVEELTRHRVVSLDQALDDLDAGSTEASVVLTFDDGFAGVYEHAWPRLRDAGLPFTIYLATAYVGGTMRWPGSTATGEPGLGLTWAQLEELAASPLVTIANHTHTHALPENLSAEELDRCSALIQERLDRVPQHFAYTWGRPVVHALPLLAERFRSAATGTLGRNLPGADRMLLDRLPVRASDPLLFFRAKLSGGLGTERAYERIVQSAKRRGFGG